MLQFIMDQNLLLYLCGAACVLGVVSQLMLRYVYGRLIGEIQSVGPVTGSFARQVCQRFKNDTHLNEKVNDIDAFADRSILDYAFWKMTLHQWRRLGTQAWAVCMLCCGAGLWLLYRNGAQITLQNGYVRAAILSSLLILLAFEIADSRHRHHSLRVRLRDYLQNTGAVRTYSEIEFSEVMQPAAAETASALGRRKLRRSRGGETGETRAQKEKKELKESLQRSKAASAEVAAAREDAPDRDKNRNLLKQMDPKEKEQILREVLLEFLT